LKENIFGLRKTRKISITIIENKFAYRSFCFLFNGGLSLQFIPPNGVWHNARKHEESLDNFHEY
jgi:hypothetical protein